MKKVMKSFLFALILTMLFGLTSQAAVKNITIRKPTNKNTTVVSLNAENPKRVLELKWTAKIKGAKNNTIKVKSSNKKVVAVKQLTKRKATLTAKNPGTAVITVYAANGKVKDTLKVTVKQKVTEIKPKYQYVYVEKGKTAKLQYSVLPKDATNKKLKFTSKNTAVATVSADGTVKGKKAGTAVIVAKATDASKTNVKFYITVGKKNKKVTKVDASVSRSEIYPGETSQITASVTPVKAINKTVRYKSMNEAIAAVSDTGLVTAKKAGTVKIKVTANDGSRKSKTVTITVKPAAKVLTVDASKFGSEYTVNTSIKWAAPATAEKAFDELASVAAISNKLTYKVVLNGKAYDMVLDSKGVSVGGKDLTAFMAESLVNSTVKRQISAERFTALLSKVEALLKNVNTARVFGDAVVKSGDAMFSVENVQLKYNELTFKMDGANVTAKLDKGQIAVTSEASLDKAVTAVSAITGGIFVAK